LTVHRLTGPNPGEVSYMTDRRAPSHDSSWLYLDLISTPIEIDGCSHPVIIDAFHDRVQIQTLQLRCFVNPRHWNEKEESNVEGKLTSIGDTFGTSSLRTYGRNIAPRTIAPCWREMQAVPIDYSNSTEFFATRPVFFKPTFGQLVMARLLTHEQAVFLVFEAVRSSHETPRDAKAESLAGHASGSSLMSPALKFTHLQHAQSLPLLSNGVWVELPPARRNLCTLNLTCAVSSAGCTPFTFASKLNVCSKSAAQDAPVPAQKRNSEEKTNHGREHPAECRAEHACIHAPFHMIAADHGATSTEAWVAVAVAFLYRYLFGVGIVT